jgi:hypothetical protein
MLRLILDGEPGTIRFDAFLRAMAAMLDGVRDVDRALSGGDRPRLDWVLDRLENSSAGAVLEELRGASGALRVRGGSAPRGQGGVRAAHKQAELARVIFNGAEQACTTGLGPPAAAQGGDPPPPHREPVVVLVFKPARSSISSSRYSP